MNSSSEKINRINELTVEIGTLPKGYISTKTVSGKTYFYHQWSENGSKKSRYLRDDEIKELSELIEKRKRLQKELSSLKQSVNTAPTRGKTSNKRAETDTIKWVLMHKRIPVAEFEIDGDSGSIRNIGKVFNELHLPVGVPVTRGIADRAALNEWWADRSIPASRSGVREALETLNLSNTKALLTRCFGLSLSDQYWICPDGSGVTWDSVNFFGNAFSNDIGDILFGAGRKKNPLDFSSPDSTSDGNLKKRWKIIDGKRCLIKGGSNPYRQQPLNEVIATEIMKRLGIPCVNYSVIWNKGAPYSVCEDFVDEKTELVPAWRIIKTQKQSNSDSLYRHFLKCADRLGIPGVRRFLDEMIVLDYIIANEDRHLNNFGALRDAETLEWIGMAPVYDSGSSLGYDKTVPLMLDQSETVCKPFKKHHDEQLKLVSSFDWVDFGALGDVKALITETLSKENARAYMDDSRIRVIAELTCRRIKNLEALAASNDRVQIINNVDEVGKNVAADYGPKL
jgi:hypothetical protein